MFPEPTKSVKPHRINAIFRASNFRQKPRDNFSVIAPTELFTNRNFKVKKEVKKKKPHKKKRCSGFNSLNSDERKSFYFRNYPLLYSVQLKKKLPAKKMTRTCRLYVVERFLQSIFFSSQTKTRKDL